MADIVKQTKFKQQVYSKTTTILLEHYKQLLHYYKTIKPLLYYYKTNCVSQVQYLTKSWALGFIKQATD